LTQTHRKRGEEGCCGGVETIEGLKKYKENGGKK